MLKGLESMCSYACKNEYERRKPKKEAKIKKCVECDKQYSGNYKYCSPKCKDKAARRRKLVKKKEGLPWHKEQAWKAFSAYVRKKEGVCFTCPSTEKLQGGHFIKAAQCNNYFNFNEKNVHAQCDICNIWKEGNYIEYTLRMIQLYGADIVQELRDENLRHLQVQATQSGYDEYRDKYKALIKELEP